MIKEIKLDNWVRAGEGNNSITYNSLEDESIMLKLAKKDIRAKNAMEKEMDIIEKAMKLNIKTPKFIEIVKCNGSMGIIYERIHDKKSLGRLCHDNPENIKEYAKKFAEEVVKLHAIKTTGMELMNYKDFYIDAIANGTQDKKYTEKVLNIIKNEINDCDTFIHGDLTVGNFIYANGEWCWIDLGKIGYGDSIFDLINVYYTFNTLSSFKFIRDLFHMSKVQLIELWDSFIKEYAYISNQNYEKLFERIKRLSVVYFFKIWASAEHHIPILYQVVHHNARKYYDEIIGKNDV